MEEALRELLLDDPVLEAHVGRRITWSIRQDDALPGIVLHRITGRPDYHLRGRSGLHESSVQADCWGRSYAEAKTTARALMDALPDLAVNTGAVVFQGAFITNERDGFEDGPTPLFRTSIDFSLWHSKGATP